MSFLTSCGVFLLLVRLALSMKGLEVSNTQPNAELANCNISMSAFSVKKSDFPESFIWGVGSSAGQVEGASLLDGRTESAWDVFSLLPGKIVDNSNASIACDFYHKHQEDLQLASQIGVGAFRFSISWSRLLPNGGTELNLKGVQYYNKILDSLKAKGMKALVTLNHMDLPYEVDLAGGWLKPTIIGKFMHYAETCFKLFGDRVDIWTTVNEPFHVAIYEYSNGLWPPARCSNRQKCLEGNSTTEPYLVMHNLLLAHGKVVELYRSRYQGRSGGKIGITLEGPYYYPYDNSASSLEAVERAFAWRFSWAWDPLYYGDYPQIMKDMLGSRLPEFSDDEKRLLKGSVDYYGLNFYSAAFVKEKKEKTYKGINEEQVENDGQFESLYVNPKGIAIGAPSGLYFRPQVPRAMFDVLMRISSSYSDIPIIIGENGYPEANPASVSRKIDLCDVERAKYFSEYLHYMSLAVKAGANVTGYFAWSLLDSWEWNFGYTIIHGTVFVDFTSPSRERYPKASYHCWSQFLNPKKDST